MNRAASEVDLGVVDPLRMPPMIGTFADRLPRVAWLLVGLAIVDAVVRLREVVGSGQSPSSIVLDGLEQVLGGPILVLLPVVILGRRRDGASSTPLVLRGAILIACFELASTARAVLMAGFFTDDLSAPLTPAQLVEPVIRLVLLILGAAGWLSLALGLARLRAGPPSVLISRTAGAVALVLIVSPIVGAVLSVYAILTDPNSISISPFVPAITVGIGSILVPVAFGYFGWVLVRGIGDPERPSRGTLLAGIAAVTAAIVSVATSVFSFVAPISDSAASRIGLVAIGLGLLWLSRLPYVLLLLAFAFGLADPIRTRTIQPEDMRTPDRPGGGGVEVV